MSGPKHATDTLQLLESLRTHRKPEEFPIPGREASLHVQPLGLGERLAFDDLKDRLQAEKVGTNAMAFRIAVYVCRHGVVNELGQKVFADDEHVEKVLGDMDPALVFDVAQRIIDISGMSPKAEEAAEKN